MKVRLSASVRWFLLALGVWLLCTLPFVTPTLGDLGGDSAHYLMLADALGHGHGYVDTHLPGAPPHIHYPPGFAVLLVPVVALFGVHAYLAVKLLLVVSMLAGFWCAFRFLRERADGNTALWAMVLAVSVPAFALDGGRIRSEAAFLPLVYLALGQIERAAPGRATWRTLGWASAATMVRLAAAPLLLLPALFGAQRDRVRSFWLLLLGLVPVGAWALWTASVGGGGTQDYATEVRGSPLLAGGIAGAVRWIGDGLWLYGRGPGWVLAHAPYPWLGDLLAFPLSGLWLIGFWRRVRRGLRPAEVFLVLELLLLAAAPQREGRYLAPLLPLFALYTVEALQWLVARLPRLRVHVLPSAVAALVFVHLLALAPFVERRLKGRIVRPPPGIAVAPVDMAQWEEGILQGYDDVGAELVVASANLLLLADWLRTHLPADAVLCSRLDRTLSLLIDRPVLPLPAAGSGAAALAALQARGVTHLIDDGRMLETRRFIDRLREVSQPMTVIAIRSAHCLAIPRP